MSAAQFTEHFPEPLFVIHRPTLRIIQASRAALEQLGLAAAGLETRRLTELLDVELPERLDPKQPFCASCHWLEASGEHSEVHLSVAAVSQNNWLVVLRRGPDPVHIAEELRRANRFLEAVVENSLESELAAVVLKANDAIVTWTPEDGRIISCNPAAEQLYGIDPARPGELTIDRFVPANLRAELQANTERLLAGHKLPVAQTFRLRGRLELEVEESLFLIPSAANGPARIASIARDIGEIARLRRAAEILAGAGAESEPEVTALATAMREVIDAADVVAQDAHASVLLLGETGVGKSWLARRIHQRSTRGKKPFLDINCAGLAPQLLESELFGYERGAFTGATGPKRGLVEAADGGTLMLDEIGELPTNVQAQLLTFLDQHRFRRVGGTRIMQADVRILAATNVNLAERVASGQFRKDLYYRLSVVPIQIPPLRQRREDIPLLVRSILSDLGKRAGRHTSTALGPGVTRALQQYDWPGNLRELRNALERALILSRGETVTLCQLPPEIRQTAPTSDRSIRLEDVERRHIVRILESCSGNRTRAAELLGISRSTLKRNLADMARAGFSVVPSVGAEHDG